LRARRDSNPKPSDP